MGRIRQVAGPGFVPETTSRECFVGPQEACPQIVVCVRGEAFRIGGRGEQNTGLPTEEFEELLHSTARICLHRCADPWPGLQFQEIEELATSRSFPANSPASPHHLRS